ncbi:MAG: hypothetical protein PF495_10125 [Spirochaetales bacterium]|nr:hypothetical protein [Spirochaetales bacterium]
MRVLITSGGTHEALDGVRSVTNFSTGATGACIADYFIGRGAAVHLLYGRAALLPDLLKHKTAGCFMEEFSSFADLDARMQRFLKAVDHLDAVIHLAAVSDFSPVKIVTESGLVLRPQDQGKIPSHEGFTVTFAVNGKIIDHIREYCGRSGSGKSPLVVGFKLTHAASKEKRMTALNKLVQRGVCDLIVHNDLHEISAGQHAAEYFDAAGNFLSASRTKQEMAEKLYQFCHTYSERGRIL